MAKKVLFLFLLLSISLCAADKLKMKSGSYMSGEVVKITEKGIFFKMDGMEKFVEFQWDLIDSDCRTTLIAKYGISKSEVVEATEEKKTDLPDKDKSELTPNPLVVPEEVKEKIEINYSDLARALFTSYLSNLKSLASDAVSNVEYIVVDGVLIKTKDGKTFRGVLDKETEIEIKLKYNDLPINLKKEDIYSLKKIVLKIKKGSLEFKEIQKYAETSVHEICLKLAAFESNVTFEEAKYVWSLRLSGGVLMTENGEKKFLTYKTNRSIDLGESSFLFGDKKSASGLKGFPQESWWNSQQMLAKENIFMVITILKNFPRTDWSDKACSACKGEGVIKSSEPAKADPKNKITKPKSTSKNVTCTVCQGIGKSYILKYE